MRTINWYRVFSYKDGNLPALIEDFPRNRKRAAMEEARTYAREENCTTKLYEGPAGERQLIATFEAGTGKVVAP